MIHDKPINVVSLFNGMSTGHQALVNLGFVIGNYYSSEIKPAAIKLTAHHFPGTREMGDIMNWRNWNIDWSSIDLVLSGSPCKDLSIAGKRKGIDGSNSGLFWVFIDIYNHIKKLNPNVLFFQENVGSAPKRDIGIMSRALGVYPIRINSSLVTAQLRDRYYWTNIKMKQDGMFGEMVVDIPVPKDRKITYQSILTSGFADRKKARAIIEGDSRPHVNMDLKIRRYTQNGFGNLVLLYEEDLKKPTSSLKGDRIRLLNKVELCRLQGFEDDFCEILTRNETASVCGDGWTLPIVELFLEHLPFKRI